MGIEDRTLPAVVHLTGAGARDVLGAAVDAGGGVLHDLRASQIQYRPGEDLVVRYRCDIDWPDGHEPRDTLLAATSARGTYPGTIPVVADIDEGSLQVSVWRWPFDPVLAGLPVAVTAAPLADRVRALGVELGTGAATLDVLAYRPTERAVVRLRADEGPTVYVKAVAPWTVASLAARHRLLLDAGLPVPRVLAADEALGLLVLAELAGSTLRDRIKADEAGWPAAERFVHIFEQLATVPTTDLPSIRGRLRDAVGHAALLRRVAPEHGPVIDRLVAAVEAALPASEARSPTAIHGDMHEAQVIVDGGAVTGLLDIDDVGVGDPLTDEATLVAHLRFRALVADEPGRRLELLRYADELRSAFAGGRDLDVLIAGVLVGLATGPFRIQRDGWRDEIGAVLADAAGLADAPRNRPMAIDR